MAAVVPVLQHGEASARRSALAVLVRRTVRAGGEAQAVLEAILPLSMDPDHSVRAATLAALPALVGGAAAAEAAGAAVRVGLEDPVAGVSCAAAWALYALSPTLAGELPRHENPAIRLGADVGSRVWGCANAGLVLEDKCEQFDGTAGSDHAPPVGTPFPPVLESLRGGLLADAGSGMEQGESLGPGTSPGPLLQPTQQCPEAQAQRRDLPGNHVPGIEVLVTELLHRLEHLDRDTLCLALSILEQVAEAGDEAVVDAVSQCLEKAEEPVKTLGLRAVPRASQALTAPPDPPATWADVAMLGLGVLGRISEKGNVVAVAAMSKWLEHSTVDIRRAALASLLQAYGRGDPAVVTAIALLLEHRDKGIRQAALSSLAEVAERGDERAFVLVTEALERGVVAARSTLVLALCHVFIPGDDRALALANQHLQDNDWEVRSAAVQLLADVTGKDDADAIALLRSHLTHPRPQVRRSAVEALPRFAGRGCEAVAKDILGLFSDADAGVRFGAVRTLPKVTRKEDGEAIAAVRQHLQDPAANVRAAAAWAVEELAAA